MKPPLLILLLLSAYFLSAQRIDSLNTAKNCSYMTEEEKEMVYEINRVRSNPSSYLQYIEPMLKQAEEDIKKYGKGERNYSLTHTTSTKNGVEVKKIDTNWHYANEEELKALSTLVDDLKKLGSLSVLKPDSGIYLAAKKHTNDQLKHKWRLLHKGSDGSWPWTRITYYSPAMKHGNENIAGSSGVSTPRSTVIQLLIDAGITHYGHRYNLLDPQWTHVACVTSVFERMKYWIQNFGAK